MRERWDMHVNKGSTAVSGATRGAALAEDDNTYEKLEQGPGATGVKGHQGEIQSPAERAHTTSAGSARERTAEARPAPRA